MCNFRMCKFHIWIARWDCAPTVCVFMCVCSSNSSTLYLSHLLFHVFAALHLSSGALYSCSNCHRSDWSSLDAMEAVIGHPRHNDQCHCYYQDFRHPGPRQGQRGTRRGEEVRLHSLLWLCRDRTTACLGVYWQLGIQHPSALSIQLIDTFPPQNVFRPHPISHPASLMGLLSLLFSCCHTSPVKGSYCVQSTAEIQALQLIQAVHFA